MIRIMIVGDHAGLRTELRRLLESEADVQVVGEATTGEEAIQLLKVFRPDIVLMDLNVPGTYVLKVTSRITSEIPAMKVIMLMTSDDADYRQQAFRAGVWDTVSKRTVDKDLITAIRRCLHACPLSQDSQGNVRKG